MPGEKLIVAAFDFDGTITYCDTFMPFLLFTTGTAVFSRNLVSLIPKYLAFKSGRRSRQRTKEDFVSVYLKGLEYAKLQAIGEAFGSSVLPRLVRRQMADTIIWHRNQGHVCILVSASLEVYVRTWANLNGFDDVLSSELDVTANGIITGRLKGKNCYGEEKVRRIKEWLGDNNPDYIYAYGDSRGDLEMLQLADTGWFKGKPL